MWALRSFAPLVLAAAGPAGAQVPAPDFDLTMPSLSTRAGTLSVILPADMRAGDTISGTVYVEPQGSGERERQRNRDELEGYVVEIDRTTVRRAGSALSFIVPSDGGALSLVILSPDGRRPLIRRRIDVAAPMSGPQGASRAMRVPSFGQQGHPLNISGPFDGNAENTRVSLGGTELAPLAESPRGVIVRVPEGPPGPMPLRVNEGQVTAESAFHRVVVSLSVPRTSLRRGERTTLSVRVEGLPPSLAPTETVPLTLTGSQTIAVDQGNMQTVMLRADQRGQASFEREVTARAPGPFRIRAVIASQTPALAN